MSLATVRLIAEAAARGLHLRARMHGDTLDYEGPKRALAELRPKLVEHKQEIIAALSQRVWLVENDDGSTEEAAKCACPTCSGDPDSDDEHFGVTWSSRPPYRQRVHNTPEIETRAFEAAEDMSREHGEYRRIRIRNVQTGEIRYVKTEGTISDVRTDTTRILSTTTTHRWTVSEEILPDPKKKAARWRVEAEDFTERGQRSWQRREVTGTRDFVEAWTALRHLVRIQEFHGKHNNLPADTKLIDLTTGKEWEANKVLAFTQTGGFRLDAKDDKGRPDKAARAAVYDLLQQLA